MTGFLLTPGFGPVQSLSTEKTVLTVLSERKPLKQLTFQVRNSTGLKPGVHETC